MTPEQFRNWQTFSLRMAHRGWERLPRKSRKKVAGMVKEFFRDLQYSDCDGTLVSRIQIRAKQAAKPKIGPLPR